MIETFRKPSTRCVRALTAGTTAVLVLGGSVLVAPAAFAAAPSARSGGSLLPVVTTGTTVGDLLGGVTVPVTAPVTAPVTGTGDGTAAGLLSGTGNGTASGALSGTGLLDGSTVGVPIMVPITAPVTTAPVILPITVGNGTSLDPTAVVDPTVSPSTGLQVSPSTGATLAPSTGDVSVAPSSGGVSVTPSTGASTATPSTTSTTSTTSTSTTGAAAPAADGSSNPASASGTTSGTAAPEADGTAAAGGSADAGSAPAAAAVRTLVRVDVTRSVATVYPRKDGYKDAVRFGVRPTAADGAPIGVRGTAVLRKGSTVVKTWTIAPSTATVTWNGRKADKVVPGSYTLTVSVGSADGATRTGQASVQVSGKRLVLKTVTTRSLKVPATVRAGIALAAARVQVTTTAKASSAGRLQLHLGAKSSTIAVKDGVHRSAAVLVPSHSSGVRFTKQWKAGQVKLKALSVRWTYKKLV